MPELWQRRTPVAAFAVLAIIMAGYLPAVAQRECPPAASDVERGRADDSTVLSREAEAGSVDVQSPVWHAMITNLPGDWARGAEATIRPAGLQTFAGVALLTAALVAADGSTYRSTQDLIGRNPWMRSGSDVFQQVGNGRTHFGIAAAFGIVGFLADDARALRTASQTVEGILATGIVVQLLKHMTGRESPAQATATGGVWRPFPSLKAYNNTQARYYAFPSGHIATTMCTVTVLADNYPEQKWIRPVGYVIVGLTGIGLVGIRYHWYSDLPLGIALGHGFGSLITHRDSVEDEAGTGEGSSSLTVAPLIAPLGSGITVALSF